ncbi:hypothetical protein MPC4_50074 [Methylocella tundrae]|uniref:Uncharacterized protein n=1 Tax=Methylocella tundrae TaxID=227605 RepID=A0A4V6IML1_METTU|nr:hypothetical protein [Methylocella tundrae]WPP06258.1 hypothetical protein SIN04_10855 [Methylocella tundrae]VFU08933.1 protein of unknown function [Methylocella tundrae]VTZ24939.1 hypothetical protein MPC1_1870004 [Methylocella tundrae]VTZ51766.1 hypothetical protein MPC4_50074 [Methylocella tundrae]
MLLDNEFRLELFSRLRALQDLAYTGRIPCGSHEHFELLALEEFESLFVLQRTKACADIALTLANRSAQNQVTVSF